MTSEGGWVRRGLIQTFVPPPKTKRARVAKCGTVSGYVKHKRNGEMACPACADASRDYQRKRRGIVIKPLKPHGTYAAWSRHYAAGTTPCQPCIDAEREYQREAKKRRRRELKLLSEEAA